MLALVNTTGVLLECHTFEVYTKILPKDRSQNVIARKSNPRKRNAFPRCPGSPLRYLRSGLSFHPKLVAGFRKSFILLNVCMAVILILALGAGIMALFGLEMLPVYNYLALPLPCMSLFSVLLLIHREIWGVHTPGGNDNASGVAVMLDSFEHLGRDLPEGAEVWAVATGCEEAGTVGMLRFLEEYGEAIKDDYIINMDNLGIGHVKYITAEGMFYPMPADRDLILAAAACVRRTRNWT